MARRSSEQVKREIASERERLGRAVRALRSRAARGRLPLVALSALGTGFVFAGGPRSIAKLAFRHACRKRKKRERHGLLSFLGRG